MTLDSIIKEMLRDLEKLKETGSLSDILDEILIFSEQIVFSDTVAAANSESTLPLSDSFSFASALSEPTTQDPGTFVYDTGVYDFSDYL